MKFTLGVIAALGVLAVSAWLLSATGFLETVASSDDFTEGPVQAPLDTYNPIQAGEETPAGFRQLLARDQIGPIYNPRFKPAGDIEWDDDTTVIGVALEGEAKAYPVSFLSSKEMVIDWIGGTPILVSW